MCVSVKDEDRADGMREKKCPFPSTGFEPVPLGYAPTVCVCVCVCVYARARAGCVTMKRKVSTTSDTRRSFKQAIASITQRKYTASSKGPFHQSITAILIEKKREGIY